MTGHQELRPMRLKATKSSLYKLVGEHADLPPMHITTFKKAHRCRSYWLHWYEGTAYLTASCGCVLLTINGENRRVYRPTLAELLGRGMIEEVSND